MDKVEQLEGRVQQLESKLAEFDLKVKVLLWAAGGLLVLITGLGISSQSIAKWYWDRQRNAIDSPIQADIQAALKADADLKSDLAATNQRPVAPGAAAPQAAGLPQVHPGAAHATRPSTPKTRTERQIAAMTAMLAQPMNDSSNATDFIPYIGQLTNCELVFISDLEAHNVGPGYQQGDTSAIYQQIFGLADRLSTQIRLHDHSPNPPDRSWHSDTWFSNFRQGLSTMETQHQQEGVLRDDQLDQWKINFVGLRNGFMIYTGSWPDPVKWRAPGHGGRKNERI